MFTLTFRNTAALDGYVAMAEHCATTHREEDWASASDWQAFANALNRTDLVQRLPDNFAGLAKVCIADAAEEAADGYSEAHKGSITLMETMKFNVTVLEHRRHVITVDADDEDEAIEAVQQQIFGKTVDLSHGETTLVEAVEVEGERDAVHAEFRAAGFIEQSTGGNCQAWTKPVGTYSLWISDEDAGLGDRRDEEYALVVTTERDGEEGDLAAATGTQSEVLTKAREAEADMYAFIKGHPL